MNHEDSQIDAGIHSRRHWLALAARIARLWVRQPQRTPDLVKASYDHIAGGYDTAWTEHMRELTLAMLHLLAPPPGATCIDLTCGTGFVASELARWTGGRVAGVDASTGMLQVARREHGGQCEFVHADALAFLRAQPRASADIVTCAWGLGYTRPVPVVREIARVLRPGGRVGIIDNSLFSLAGVLWASMLAFAEQPEALVHVMQVRFLPHSTVLASIMRACGLAVRRRVDGSRSYFTASGPDAVERLTATGAAAGFEFAAAPEHREHIFRRFGEILEHSARIAGGIRITHRWLMAIGEKR